MLTHWRTTITGTARQIFSGGSRPVLAFIGSPQYVSKGSSEAPLLRRKVLNCSQQRSTRRDNHVIIHGWSRSGLVQIVHLSLLSLARRRAGEISISSDTTRPIAWS